MFTPADTAALQRFRPMLAQAMSSATREELHAVSEVTLGPHGSPGGERTGNRMRHGLLGLRHACLATCFTGDLKARQKDNHHLVGPLKKTQS